MRTLRVLWLSVAAFGAAAPSQTPTLVQQVAKSGKVTTQVTLNQLPGAGNLLVACCNGVAVGSSLVTGGGVTAWNLCQSTAPGTGAMQIWSGLVDGTPSTTLTVTFGGVAPAQANVSEWTGVTGLAPIVGAARHGSSRIVDGGTVPVEVGDLVISAFGADDPREPEPAPGGGFTALSGAKKTDRMMLGVAWRVPVATGTTAASWTFLRSQNWKAVTACFRVPVATAAPQLVQLVSGSRWATTGLQYQLPHPPTPGNLLVICHESNSSGNSTVTGGGVPSWTLCTSTAPIPVVNTEIWAGRVGNSPSQSISITLGSSPNGCIAVISEWSGFGPLWTFRVNMSFDNTLIGSRPVFTGSEAVVPGELAIATAGIHQGANFFGTPTNGFVEIGELYLPSTGLSAAYLVPTAPAQVSTSWTMLFNTRWAAPLVVFGHGP